MKTSFRIFSLRIFTALMLFTSLGAGSSLHAQIITTIAGTGIPGSGGDGGAAIGAQFFDPGSVAVDGSGNVYISDQGSNRIRKITATTGLISTIAGTGIAGFSGDGGPAVLAQLNSPKGISIDRSGNVYIADGHHIRKITAVTGFITTIAGIGPNGSDGDGGPATAAQLNFPQDVTLDGSGNVYIADTYNHRIRKITAANGIISTIAGSGIAGSSGDGGVATDARINIPQSVAVDDSQNVYLIDLGDQRIRKITASTGIISTMAGTGTGGFSGDSGAATEAQLCDPEDLAVDTAGNLYIADFCNSRIRKITASTGVISTIAGTGKLGIGGDGREATSAQLNNPTGVAVDNTGNVYIADNRNYRIRKITGFKNVIEAIAPPSTIVAAYPNPTTGVFVLEISKVRAGATILVTDVTGNIRATKSILRGELPTVTLDLTGFAKGMYLVQIRDGELNYRTKIVVQ
ncbi:MAG: T9SS type A sorting domain-containing protein [Candidatus Kapaibacterium sp.]|jgi:sugar lactone lactonase YvrE